MPLWCWLKSYFAQFLSQIKWHHLTTCTSLNEARVQMWQNKMRRNTQTVCSSPDWGSVSTECSASTSCSCCLEGLCERTYPIPDTSRTWVVPSRRQTISPSCCSPCKHTLDPAELLKVLKCGCCSNTPCNTRRCTCKANGLDCTLFYQCRGEDDCHNKRTIYITMTMFTWICTVIWWNVNLMPIAICLKLSGPKVIWLNL